MARRGKGHKPTNRGVKPGAVRGPYQRKAVAEAAAPDALYGVGIAERAIPPTGQSGTTDAPVPSEPVNHADVTPEPPPAAAPLTARGARSMSLYATAQTLGVDRAVIDRWIKRDGAPVVREGQGRGKGLEWELSLPDLWAWWGEHNRRLALAEAGVGRHIEPKDRETLLKVARLAKLVVPVATVDALLAQVLKDARTTLYAIPGRLVRAMAGLPPDKVAGFKVAADIGVREALEEFERALFDIDLSPSEDVVIVEGDGGRHDQSV